MSFDKKQFRSLIERILGEFDGLHSETAVNLLLGTAAQESRFGTFLRQLKGGPALGVFQMEPKTFWWLHGRYKKKYPLIADRLFAELEWDLSLAIVMARLRYRVVRAKLPRCNSIKDMAVYWKKFYNTVRGKGTVDEFMANYKKYVD